MNDPHDTPNPPPPAHPGALNYQSRGEHPALAPPSVGRTLRGFFIGLIAGTALSAIVWVFAFKSVQGAPVGVSMVIIPLLKLATGITLLCLRGRRSLGAGILVSLALGFLIFFGVCAMHIGDTH